MRIQLAKTFSYSTNPLASPTRALEYHLEAIPFLEASSPLTQSHLFVTQAVSYALCSQEQEARKSLERAQACFPTSPEEDPAFLYADFGRSTFLLWEGLTLLELARHGLTQSKEAWDVFVSMEGSASERDRVETINHLAETAIVMDELDGFCTYLQRGIEGAKRLGSARRRQEATSNYWQARKRWPQEARVKELAELFMQDAPGGEILA